MVQERFDIEVVHSNISRSPSVMEEHQSTLALHLKKNLDNATSQMVYGSWPYWLSYCGASLSCEGGLS